MEWVILIAMGVLVVAVTLIFARTMGNAMALTNSIHQRQTETQKDLLDRLMAMDFATYKAYSLAENAPVGEQYIPEPEPLEGPSVEQVRPRNWGYEGEGVTPEPDDDLAEV